MSEQSDRVHSRLVSDLFGETTTESLDQTLLRAILTELQEIRRLMEQPQQPPSQEEIERAARITFQTGQRVRDEVEALKRMTGEEQA